MSEAGASTGESESFAGRRGLLTSNSMLPALFYQRSGILRLRGQSTPSWFSMEISHLGLFDSIKAVAAQATDAAAAVAANQAAQLWAAHKDTICDTVMKYAAKAAESGSTYISDDVKYRTHVIDPVWDLLPMPIRLIGRERLQWDSMFYKARTNLFVVDGDSVSLHPDARQRLEQMITRSLPSEQPKDSTAALEVADEKQDTTAS